MIVISTYRGLRDACRFTHQSVEFLIVMSRSGRWEFHQVQILIENVQGGCVCGSGGGSTRRPRLLLLLHEFLQFVHLFEKRFRRFDGRQSIRWFLLIGPKGIAEQVHASLHIVPTTVSNFFPLASGIPFGALSGNILTTGWDDYHTFGIKECSDRSRRDIAFDKIWTHDEKFVYRLLNATIIPPFGNGDGSIPSSSGTTAGISGINVRHGPRR